MCEREKERNINDKIRERNSDGTGERKREKRAYHTLLIRELFGSCCDIGLSQQLAICECILSTGEIDLMDPMAFFSFFFFLLSWAEDSDCHFERPYVVFYA